jgi:hypothetical protein
LYISLRTSESKQKKQSQANKQASKVHPQSGRVKEKQVTGTRAQKKEKSFIISKCWVTKAEIRLNFGTWTWFSFYFELHPR